jgi:hypothetical protein
MFIEVSHHAYISIYICTVFKKINLIGLLDAESDPIGFQWIKTSRRSKLSRYSPYFSTAAS